MATFPLVFEFETSEPVSAVIDVVTGEVRIAASERANTIVQIRPSDPARRADVSAAEQTRVECVGGRLSLKTTRRWKSYSPFSDGGSVDVLVELPAGSSVTGEAAMAAFRSTGPLGDSRVKTAVGDVDLEQTADAKLSTSLGDISLGTARGDVDVSTASGEVRVGDIAGTALIKNSNGGTRIGAADGHLRVRAANGDIAVERARESVAVKTAKGAIRVGAVDRGVVVAETGFGEIEIGVADGTAAWLDLTTGFGRVESDLDAGGPPESDENRVEVRARSGYGDITIRRVDAGAT